MIVRHLTANLDVAAGPDVKKVLSKAQAKERHQFG
jgi:hypothetical protein